MNMNLQEYVAIYSVNKAEVCKQLIAEIDNLQWNKHSYNDPITNKYITYEDDLEVLSQDKVAKEYLADIIKNCLNEYLTKIVPNQFSLQEICDIRFNRYKVGTNMKIHHDHIHTLFDGEKKGVPILTILGLLNDDFEGGDFLMFDGKKLNLSAGDIVIFPSNFLYPHGVTTVTKGTRYSFVAWGW
jgi:predicted 2-oxoglutarate/Fe(II)-dependent dioxygenase YbiX